MADTMKIIDMDDYDKSIVTRNGFEYEAFIKKEPYTKFNAGDIITITANNATFKYKIKYIGNYKTKLNLTLERL